MDSYVPGGNITRVAPRLIIWSMSTLVHVGHQSSICTFREHLTALSCVHDGGSYCGPRSAYLRKRYILASTDYEMGTFGGGVDSGVMGPSPVGG